MSEGTKLAKQELWNNFHNKEYRDAFVASQLSTNIGSQIFSMREGRGWSQGKLAEAMGMAQPRISLLESGYEKYSLTTLKRIASAYDVAIVVRFVPFSELVDWVTNLSEERLAPVEFANDNLSEENNAAAAYEPAEAAESSPALYSEAEALPATGAAIEWAIWLNNAPDVTLPYGRVLALTQGGDVVANGKIQNRLLGLSGTLGAAPVIINASTATGMSVDLTSLYAAETSRVMAEVSRA